MKDPQLKSWLALSHMSGMTALRINRLLCYFSSPEAILSSDQATLKSAGIASKLRTAIKAWQQAGKSSAISSKVEQSLSWQKSNKRHYIVSKGDALYPDLLHELPDAPPVLYVNGDVEKLILPQLAMVGSRNPGPVARKNARRFARELSQCGYLICSGMALGIDYESHMGALEEGYSTLAVLGTGIDQIYPNQNRLLAQRIIENGALVSEFPLGTWPSPANFPQRNRLISGMSHGTLVVEAALRSGSLITARYALEQGREVFAVPGSIHSATTRGCHALIKDGAKLIEKTDDIIEELGAFIALAREQNCSAKEERLPIDLDRVLAEIDHEPVSIDSLITKTKLDVAHMNVVLMELELQNLVEAVAGGYILSIR